MPSSKFKTSIFVALPLVALAVYFASIQLSGPMEQDLMREFKASRSVAPDSGDKNPAAPLESVDILLVGLEQRLETRPNDVDGWALLSKSYYHLNRWQEADEAFERARALGYTGSWQPLPRIDTFTQNDFSSQNFNSSISFRDYKIKGRPDQAKNQTGATGSQAGPKITGALKLKVSLNPALQKEFSPESPVFIFVRAAENPGPPLAVIRKKVNELPFEVAINDSHSMIPGRTISSASNVIVGVRISISGNPERQPGDYEQLSNSISSKSNRMLELVINDKI